MHGDLLSVKIMTIIDEIERRLKDDSRMPGNVAGFSISPLEVRRGERFEDVPDHYPIAYIVFGEVSEDEISSRTDDFTLTVWIQVFVKERDSIIGTEEIMKYTLSIRRVFREMNNDKRLASNGVALVRHVATPSYGWGAFQPIGDSTEWEFGGQVQLEISFSIGTHTVSTGVSGPGGAEQEISY